jgi:hypothetical protein
MSLFAIPPVVVDNINSMEDLYLPIDKINK